MNSLKMIIDTDPGIDDAMAVLFAGSCNEIELIGLTSTYGNVDIDTATHNALVLGDILGKDIPVARGCACPLKQSIKDIYSHVHGVGGFGNAESVSTSRTETDLSAASYLISKVSEQPGRITICPIGPLTNIASAIQSDSEFCNNVKAITIMGGGVYSGGNITEYAEANIWADPYAASIVLSSDCDLTLIGLDVTTKVVCVRAQFEELALANQKPGGFLKDATEFYFAFHKKSLGIDGCQMHDPTAIISTVYPDLFRYEYIPLEVILEGERAGETLLSNDQSRRKVRVAIDVDAEGVKQVFFNTLSKRL